MAAVLISLAAAVWFFTLSGWLIAAPDRLMLRRLNLFFQSDVALSVHVLSGQPIPSVARPITSALPIVHPLVPSLWQELTRLANLTAGALGPAGGEARGPRLLVALIAGAGVGGLALVAQGAGVSRLDLVFAMLVYFLFSAHVIVALPEHFGLSNGLLSVAFCSMWLWQRSKVARPIGVAALALAVGTTITNVVFAGMGVAGWAWRRRNWPAVAAIAGLGVLVTAAAELMFRARIDWFLGSFLNARLLQNPIEAIGYLLMGFVYPAVGSDASLRAVDRSVWPLTSPEPFVLPPFAVSYEPLDPGRYSLIGLVGAMAWMILLIRTGDLALRDVRTRPWAGLLLVWIGFNLLLHNVWGDEFFLYSPHWSWALMGIVLLGMCELPRWFTIATTIAIAAGEIHALRTIRVVLDEAIRRSS